MRARQRCTVSCLLLAALLLAACTAQAQSVSSDAGSTGTTFAPNDPNNPDAPVALVVVDGGLAGVVVGTSTPRWTVAGAVAAPDGSAVYVARPTADGTSTTVVRIDPRTGGDLDTVGSIGGAAHVAAVRPGGGLVALAERDVPTLGDITVLTSLDTTTGAPAYRVPFEGDLEPEAYGTDPDILFAARINGASYHVHTLNLKEQVQRPTTGPPDPTTKPLAEDMYGSAVQAALSPDGTQLATLYRDAVKPDHTAFVHLLNLSTGFTVCIDLHAPFGTEAVSADALAWTVNGSVIVSHHHVDGTATSATFSPAAIWKSRPQPHHHADVRAGLPVSALPEGIAHVAGFRRFVALVP